ncbi:MAG: folate-binding protein, partial [Propionibacteriaceae bacterium]|nr:folate-binding protein [Propionibacteriaceae bacterium]
AVSGPDRLSWLHAITSQDFNSLRAGERVSAYILNHQGHIVHAFSGSDDGEVFHAHTEPGCRESLLAWLGKMIFAKRVRVGPVEADRADAGPPVGLWAYEALRIAQGRPRHILDTDEKTIPNEIAMPDGDRLGEFAHLKKGCYPGQETVARVYNLGAPPRRLTRLLLDGSVDRLPAVGAEVCQDGDVVGRMGSSAIHHELGPIGLALLKRSLPVAATVEAEGIAASQEVIVDPEVGLHWRPPSDVSLANSGRPAPRRPLL